MTNERNDDTVDWARVERLFPDLLALPPGQRARFLDRHCAGSPALRRELEAMLAASGRATLFDRIPQVRAQPGEDTTDPGHLDEGTRIGAWRIVRQVGRGGMGEVYLAERADGGFEQRAAIKLLQGDAVQHAERFEEERRILAQLTHPNIARLLDGGVHGDRAWMAMEFIEGSSITEHCRRNALPLAARLKLFHQACAAAADAHAAMIVHRDLKPSNILVDDSGVVKLLDFGIAKLLQPQGAPDPRITQAAPFTPDHAAPEQIEGGPTTTAVDIYALGVVLYEMLSGTLPWSFGDTALSRAVDRLLREDPPPPSRATRGIGEGALPADVIDADLDAIVARCLRRLPQDRYPTVQALQDDLDRFARQQPVIARAGGRRYVARLWLRRHRRLAAALCIAGLALFTGSGLALWQAGIARREAAQAQAQQHIAEAQRAQVAVQADSSLAVQELLMQMFSHAMAADGGKTTSVRDVVEMLQMMGAQRGTLDGDAKAQLFLRLAKLAMISGDTDAATQLIERARPLVAKAGGARPRLLAQQLDAQQTLAVSMNDPQAMVQLAMPLLRLLDTLPQPLDAEMLEVRLNALRTRGWGLDQQGRGDDAIMAKREVVDAILARFGPDHPRSLVARSELGRAYLLAGRYSESASLLRETQTSQAAEPTTSRVAGMIERAQALRQSAAGPSEALRQLDEAHALAVRDRLPALYVPWIQAIQADILREQGDTQAAMRLLESASAFVPDPDAREQRGVRALVLAARSDVAWALGDARASAADAQAGLEFLRSPGSNSERQKFLGLRLRLLRAQASTQPPDALRGQVDAIVRDLDALRIAQRGPYLTMAAETLRLGGIQDAALAMSKRAVAASDAEPEPNPRVQAKAREELQRATSRL